MTAAKEKHIEIERTSRGVLRMFCWRCNRTALLMPPFGADTERIEAQRFIDKHRDCSPQQEAPTP